MFYDLVEIEFVCKDSKIKKEGVAESAALEKMSFDKMIKKEDDGNIKSVSFENISIILKENPKPKTELNGGNKQ